MDELGFAGVAFEVKFAEDGGAPAGSFEGYAAVFGNVDAHGDVIEPGAFAKSLLERSRQGRPLPPMYKMHGAMTGNRHEPVGLWTQMAEDSNGLSVKGRLVGLDTEQGKWTYAQLKEGALKGLSIGYSVPPHGARKGSGKPGEPRRIIKQAELAEVSLVDQPSNARAMIYALKMRAFGNCPAETLTTIRDFEAFLRDAGGFSHAAAKAIAAGGFKARPDPRDEDGIGDFIKGSFGALATTLKP